MLQLFVYISLLQLGYSVSSPHERSENDLFQFEYFRSIDMNYMNEVSIPNGRLVLGLEKTSEDENVLADLNPHIVGGNLVSAQQRYPYLAVMTNDFSKFSHLCAASLVADDFFLSAAHCTKYFMGEVGMGVTDLRDLVTTPRPNNVNIYKVDKHFVHPEYDSQQLRNDIVLYKIKNKVSPKYQPVKLNVNVDLAKSYEPTSDTTTVMGWGFTSDGGKISAELRHVDIDPISHEECYDKWWDATGYKYKLNETIQLCCFTEGKATCNGDSGGPLILNGKDPKSDTQVGVVSFGSSLGCNHLPTVFTRIDTKINWIKSVLCEHSVSPPSYLNCNGVPSPLETDNSIQNPLVSNKPTSESDKGIQQKILVKIEVMFDHKPWETGWKLEKVHDEHSSTTVIASAKNGTYQIANILASEIFPLDRYSSYCLTVTDDASDGLAEDAFVRASILIDDVPLKIFEIQEFGAHATERFYLGRHESPKTESTEEKIPESPKSMNQSVRLSSSYLHSRYILLSTCALLAIWMS